MTPSEDRACWDDAAAYRWCLSLDRAGFAWEFLRRNTAYRVLARSLGVRPPGSFVRLTSAAQHAFAWGLSFAEDDHVTAATARALWLAEADPQVLIVEALPARPGADAIDFAHLATPLVVLTDIDGTEHLLLRDAVGRLRVDIIAGTSLCGPITPRIALTGLDAVGPKLLALRRLRGLSRQGRFPRALFAPERRAARWTAMLRVLDGIEAGASQREIAAALFGRQRVAESWRGTSDYLRLAVQRLGRDARAFVDHGYRSLLDPPDRL